MKLQVTLTLLALLSVGTMIAQDKPAATPPANAPKTKKLTDDKIARHILEAQHKIDQVNNNANTMQRQIDGIVAQMKEQQSTADKEKNSAIDEAYKEMKLDKDKWDFSVDNMEFTEKKATKDEKGSVEEKPNAAAPPSPSK